MKRNMYQELLEIGLPLKYSMNECVQEGKFIDVMDLIVHNWGDWTEEEKNKVSNYLLLPS